jgi:hypothetical protein
MNAYQDGHLACDQCVAHHALAGFNVDDAIEVDTEDPCDYCGQYDDDPEGQKWAADGEAPQRMWP